MVVRTAIQRSGLPRAQLARDAGVSEASVWAWLKGDRSPSPESLRQLAAGLRRRGTQLEEIAAELERAAADDPARPKGEAS